MPDLSAENMAIATAIGEVKGMMESLQKQIHQGTESTNLRISDLSSSMDKQTDAINRRIEDHDKANHLRFVAIESRLDSAQSDIDSRKHDGKKALGSGSVAGAIAAVSIELVKRFSEGG